MTLALGLSITALSFNRMRAATLQAGEQLIEVTGTAINGDFAKARLEVTGAMASAAGGRLATAQTYAARANAREDLLPMVAVNPIVVSARAGFPDGDLFTARKLRATDAAPAAVRARAVYIIIGGRANAGRAEVRSWVYDRDMRFLGTGEQPANSYYDPRLRPWFDALLDTATFSAPYVSRATDTLVVSISQRTASGSVFDEDLELDTYSGLLHRLRPTPSALGAIVTVPGAVVLAFSNVTALNAITRRNGGRPLVLADLHSAPLTAALSASADLTRRGTGDYRDRNGRTWLCSVTPVRDSAGSFLGRAVLLAVPEDELLVAALRERNAALMLCLGIVLAMIPIAYLLSKLLSEPIDELRRDAVTLRNLDFSPQPRRQSLISEIDELSETFLTMRRHVREHNEAVERFVPRTFLETLGRRDITGLQLGDHSQGVMTLMFVDMRSFTTLSEKMTPEDTFRFVNSYLREVGPIIREHGGFIDKYIGDAIMAIFPDRPSDAVDAAIAMQRRLAEHSLRRTQVGLDPIAIGIGIHRGPLMLGTIGEEERFETTVISDTVNIAARIEGLTKPFGALILAGGDVVDNVDPSKYFLRDVGEILVKGATHPVTVYEVCDADPGEVLAYKTQTKQRFEEGRAAYFRGDFSTSFCILDEVARDGYDRVAAYYRGRAAAMESNRRTDWDGVERMESK